MTLNLARVTAFVVVATCAVLAQTKPNFSGTWVAISGAKEALGQEIWIKHDATSIAIGHGGSVEHAAKYLLDGQERKQPNLAHPSEMDLTQAKWDGEKVVITVKMANGAVHTQILSMQPDGLMVLEVAAELGGKTETLKAVHKKK